MCTVGHLPASLSDGKQLHDRTCITEMETHNIMCYDHVELAAWYS